MYIDVYLDRAFIARFHLTAEKLNPVLGLHLKVAAGKLLALENCNIHGRWVSEVVI
jgi:desulfoferrodoxin (superoxide reductase-like protein)